MSARLPWLKSVSAFDLYGSDCYGCSKEDFKSTMLQIVVLKCLATFAPLAARIVTCIFFATFTLFYMKLNDGISAHSGYILWTMRIEYHMVSKNSYCRNVVKQLSWHVLSDFLFQLRTDLRNCHSISFTPSWRMPCVIYANCKNKRHSEVLSECTRFQCCLQMHMRAHNSLKLME